MANKKSLPPCDSILSSYDHIMMIQDQEHSTRPGSNMVKFVFIVSCGFVTLLGGFGLQLVMSGRKYRTSLKTKPSKDKLAHDVDLEDPVLFASRALAWGTLLSLLGTGSIGLATVGIWKLLVEGPLGNLYLPNVIYTDCHLLRTQLNTLRHTKVDHHNSIRQCNLIFDYYYHTISTQISGL